MKTDESILTAGPKAIVENVNQYKKTFSEHGNEIEEIISRKPPFIVSWGTVLFSAFLFIIALICWYIQYPDIVLANAKLNCINAPKQVVARTDGKLMKIEVKETGKVSSGQILGYMESIADPKSVKLLHLQIDSIIRDIDQNRTDEIIKYFPKSSDGLEEGSKGALGELQSNYQTFIQAFIIFKDFLSNGFYLRKKKMLATDIKNIKRLQEILTDQKALLQQDLSLSDENFKANESLEKDKVISIFDYRNEKSKLIAKQLSLPQINSAIVSNENQQNEKRKEIEELENQIVVQKNIFIQALQTMKSQIQAWEYKYLLKAPVDGTLSFTGFIQENQEIKSGQPLFYVHPANTLYFVELLIPQYNFGKVKLGQQVLLKFQAYPFEQYGSVIGKIDYINALPVDSGYLAKVVLPNGLITNDRKILNYRNGLLAEADIITKNTRLLERFYYNIIKEFKRK